MQLFNWIACLTSCSHLLERILIKFKEFDMFWALFQDMFTHFLEFWIPIEVMILVMSKQEVEQKASCLRREFFYSIFKVEWENGVRLQKQYFIFSHAAIRRFFVRMLQFDSVFLNLFIAAKLILGTLWFFFNLSFPSTILTTRGLGIDF